MTIEEARKILNVSEEDLSEEEVRECIEIATLFKDIFFDMLKAGQLKRNK